MKWGVEMGSYIKIDPKGIWGTAFALIKSSKKMTDSDLNEIIHLLEENFERLARRRPAGGEEFRAMVLSAKGENRDISLTDIIGSRLFQSMQAEAVDLELHHVVKKNNVPSLWRSFCKQYSLDEPLTAEVEEWVARTLESYLPKEQILREEMLSSDPQAIETRKEIGIQLSRQIELGNFKEEDLNVLIEVLSILAKFENPQLASEFVGKYATLTASCKTPKAMAEALMNSLNTTLRNKYFPPKE